MSIRKKYNVFVREPDPTVPAGESWHKIAEKHTQKTMEEFLKVLRKRGITEYRVAEVSTREIYNTLRIK